MRDHNYQSRTKYCHTIFIVTVENEKSFYEKKITVREYRLVFFFLAAKPKQSVESILEGLSLILNGGATGYPRTLQSLFIDSLVLFKEPLQLIVHLII